MLFYCFGNARVQDCDLIYQINQLGHTDRMFGLLTSLVVLGLLAIDPIGIAVMPVLLSQKDPYGRSFVFLGGSFGALVMMGLLFAYGLGTRVLYFENHHTWVVPSVELAAGLVLCLIAGVQLLRLRSGQLATEPSDTLMQRLRLNNWRLFVLGAALVAVQSVVDVVFVVAMIRIGQLHLSAFSIVSAVITYAVAALVLQLAVVVAYKVTPTKRRFETLDKIHELLTHFGDRALIGASLVLGGALFINGVLAVAGLPHL